VWFVPNSRLNKASLESMSHEVAFRTPQSLLELSKTILDCDPPSKKKSSDFLVNKKVKDFANSLGDSFKRFGSDKSIHHDYQNVYAHIIMAFHRPLNILEIGLGSHNKNIASHMTNDFNPGGSLNAFKSLLPNSTIHGADIDEELIINGFEVFNIDQTKPTSFSIIKSEGAVNYDLIIDDGLHSPNANLNTLNFALSSISSEGVVVIEDIPERCLPIWETVQLLFKGSFYKTLLVKDRDGYLFLCSPKTSGKIDI
tara:strand:+ start:77 stop:841 length:765 start_codon:yes stop_codon:yes gene_type:complete